MHVNLYALKGKAKLNMNELLIEKKFCTMRKSAQIFSLTPDIPYGANSDLMKKQPSHKPVQNTITFEEKPPMQHPFQQPNVTQQLNIPLSQKPITPEEILERSYKKQSQMEEKKKETTKVINEECQDLLNLLHGESILHTSNNPATDTVADYGVSSGVSDFSDIESTPVPKSASYKSGERFKGQNRAHAGENALAKVLGIQQTVVAKEKPKLNKLDAFLNECSQPFEIIDDTEDIQVPLAGPSDQIMRVIGSGAKQKVGKDTLQLDVLVYGKEKRNPLKHLEDLTLPDQIYPELKSLNFDKPSQFQMNIWPAILALKNVVGIADNYSSDISRILAYVLPLLKILLTDQVLYSELGGGNGVIIFPFFIINIIFV